MPAKPTITPELQTAQVLAAQLTEYCHEQGLLCVVGIQHKKPGHAAILGINACCHEHLEELLLDTSAEAMARMAKLNGGAAASRKDVH